MPLPLVPVAIVAGAAALLFAGHKEAAPVAMPSPGSPATPTQASTGGEAGGAQYPSHSDTAAKGDSKLDAANDIATAPAPQLKSVTDAIKATLGDAAGTISSGAGAVETGQESAFNTTTTTQPASAWDPYDAFKALVGSSSGLTPRTTGTYEIGNDGFGKVY